jgi:exopolysaccharide biosynthesis polyprenyl glycosylphosphotransferase
VLTESSPLSNQHLTSAGYGIAMRLLPPNSIWQLRPQKRVRRPAEPQASGECWAPSDCWHDTAQRLTKRTLDIAGASVALLLLLPLLLVIAVLVWLSSPGPVFFRQTRIGKDGRHFEMYKFRTMFADCDTSMHRAYYENLVRRSAQRVNGTFKLANDTRVTKVGRILRRLSLDEVPQFLNVLRGDMSLVGPRPPLPYEVDLYDERAKLRLSVTPGMTGLWQISGRSELDFHQMIDLDLQYITFWSVWFDLLILMRTPLVLITRRGAH